MLSLKSLIPSITAYLYQKVGVSTPSSTLRFYPFKHTDVHGENFILPPPDLIEEQPEYKIEAIISHRRSGKGRAYLVKWKGYPTSENTWEPEQNLYNAREILKQYKIRHQL